MGFQPVLSSSFDSISFAGVAAFFPARLHLYIASFHSRSKLHKQGNFLSTGGTIYASSGSQPRLLKPRNNIYTVPAFLVTLHDDR